jgi:hypothetical protein
MPATSGSHVSIESEGSQHPAPRPKKKKSPAKPRRTLLADMEGDIAL